MKHNIQSLNYRTSKMYGDGRVPFLRQIHHVSLNGICVETALRADDVEGWIIFYNEESGHFERAYGKVEFHFTLPETGETEAEMRAAIEYFNTAVRPTLNIQPPKGSLDLSKL